MSILEAGMVICFGASWPFAIAKTIRTKSVHGKSKTFLALILSGYGLGVLHKIFMNLDYVLILYVFNFIMVLTELILHYAYAKKDTLVEVEDSTIDDMFPDDAYTYARSTSQICYGSHGAE